ncbi:hypothetical protein [Streptomyces umbrinus]
MTATQPSPVPAPPPETCTSGRLRADEDLLRCASSTLRTRQSA